VALPRGAQSLRYRVEHAGYERTVRTVLAAFAVRVNATRRCVAGLFGPNRRQTQAELTARPVRGP